MEGAWAFQSELKQRQSNSRKRHRDRKEKEVCDGTMLCMEIHPYMHGHTCKERKEMKSKMCMLSETELLSTSYSPLSLPARSGRPLLQQRKTNRHACGPAMSCIHSWARASPALPRMACLSVCLHVCICVCEYVRESLQPGKRHRRTVWRCDRDTYPYIQMYTYTNIQNMCIHIQMIHTRKTTRPTCAPSEAKLYQPIG